MKKIFFWLALIVGILAIIGSCAKKDESTTTTTTTLSAPTGLTATGGASQVVLDWTAVSGATSYTVYWGTATGVSSSSTAITSVSTDNYTHSGLDSARTYYYKVAAVDSAGTGSLSSEANATTSMTTTTPSGSITMGSYTVSGVYKSACISSGVSTYIAAGLFPVDVQSYGFAFVVTGNDNFTTETHSYGDTGCATSSYIQKLVRDNVTVGTASGSNYPVTYNDAGIRWTVNSTTAETYLEALLSSSNIDMTLGTEKVMASSTRTFYYNLLTPSATTISLASESSEQTPSTAGTLVLTKE